MKTALVVIQGLLEVIYMQQALLMEHITQRI